MTEDRLRKADGVDVSPPVLGGVAAASADGVVPAITMLPSDNQSPASFIFLYCLRTVKPVDAVSN